MKTDSVQVLVTQQGDAVCGKEGYMLEKSGNVAAFYLDGWGNTGRIYPISTCESSWMNGTNFPYPGVTLEDGDKESSFTEICFPEYEGWRVHCVSGGKTMSVCLVKNKE